MRSCCSAGVWLATALAGLFPSFSFATQTIPGHLRPENAAIKSLGSLPLDRRLHLQIGLPLRNQETLTNLLTSLYDPASASYRKYLTPDEFAAQFGPAKEDYDSAIAFFRAEGFEITATHPNRILIDVAASVGQIEKTFNLSLRVYQHPTEARTFFAPDQEPAVDLPVPLLHVTGLDDFVLPRPASLHVQPQLKDQNPQPQVGSSQFGSYMGRDFRAAYAPNVTLTGIGQYVGLLQFDGYYLGDISSYVAQQTGYTNVPLINVLLDGFNGHAGANNVEVALDIEMSISMAPGLSGVIVYEGNLGNSILNRMATDNLAKQLSSSWTFNTDATSTQIFQQFAVQGQSYFNAAGDSGAYTGSIPAPCDSPYITSVGGTTLSTRSAGGAWLSETTWNWASSGQGSLASSGGISPSFTIPAWQQGIDMSTNHGSTIMRNLPDVSMVSDNVYVIFNNGTASNVGGDSVASPLWAAFIALANQQASISGQPTVGFLNPAIYALGKGTNFATILHDIKTGNNTNSSSPLNYYAATGYDLCTGWGTPAGKPLINALAPPVNAPLIIPGAPTIALETCSAANGVVDPGEAVTVNFSLQNFGGVNTTNLIATLLSTNGIVPASNPQAYGALAAGGAAVSRSFTFIADVPCGIPAVPVLQLQDGANDLGLVSVTMQTGVPITAYSQNFDTVSPPALPSGWGTLQTGGATNWVTSNALRDSVPNAAFAFEATNASIADLLSPVIAISSASAQLSFRNNFNTEVDPTSSSAAFDAGVLDISVGGTAYTDIITAGGSFVSGGYNRSIQAADNPLNGRSCWGGTSGGFINSVINLPPAAAGRSIRLKWRFAVDNGNFYGGSGWAIDSVVLKDGASCCTPFTNADLAVTQSVFPNPGAVGQTLAYTLSVSNAGPGPATVVILSNALPPNATFSFASPGYSNYAGTLVWNLGLMPSGRNTNLVLLVTPTAEGQITNTAAVSSLINDPGSANNLNSFVTAVYTAPAVALAPTNLTVLPGSNVQFIATATGSAPLTYQWQFAGASLPGETSSALQLTQVQPAQAGTYTVVVTNLAGSVTSPTATLRVLVTPTIDLSHSIVTTTNISLALSSVNGLNYTLEYKNALPDPAWTVIAGPVPGNGSVILLQDTNAPALPSRFYRVNCN